MSEKADAVPVRVYLAPSLFKKLEPGADAPDWNGLEIVSHPYVPEYLVEMSDGTFRKPPFRKPPKVKP